MHVDIDFILLLAAGLSIALLLGMMAKKIHLPVILGYMMTGLFLSPYVGIAHISPNVIHQMAELGIIFLMFEVGLHFSWKDLSAVKGIAISGALIQMLIATIAGTLLGLSWDWSILAALTFGLSLSVASTLVLIRGLDQAHQRHTINGKIAVGWLIVEDIMTVLALLILPVFASLQTAKIQGWTEFTHFFQVIGLTLLKLVSFTTLLIATGKWGIPQMLRLIARQGTRELFTIAIVALAVGTAFLAYHFFNVSMALGAFIAGMIVKQSNFNKEAEDETYTLRGVFSVLFFISVGMLFNPAIFIDAPEKVIAVITVILFLKAISAILIILAKGYPLNTAMTVGAGLAQIGEFSFILTTLAGSLGIISKEVQQLILAGAFISISINPFLFSQLKPFESFLTSRFKIADRLANRLDALSMLPDHINQEMINRQVVIIGFGTLGKLIYNELNNEFQTVIVDENRELIENLRSKGMTAVFGDATLPMTLVQAHVHKAKTMIITMPDQFEISNISKIARQLNADIDIIICAESIRQFNNLENSKIGTLFSSPHLMAHQIGKYLQEKTAH